MKFKVLYIYEEEQILHVIVETPYGKKDLRMNIENKFIHLATGKPAWMHKIKEFLEKKYEKVKEPVSGPEFDNYIGQEYDTSEIEDRSVEALHKEVVKKRAGKEKTN